MPQTYAAAASAPASSWNSLPVGGGGNQTKMAISKNGFIFSGSDTTSGGGVNGGSTVAGTVNTFLATPSSCPAAYQGTPIFAGDCYGLGLDPSNDNNLYFWQSPRNGLYNLTQLWKTSNKGVTWTVSGFPLINADGNESLREKKNNQIAVDPANSLVVYAGGPTGFWVSFDQGVTSASVGSGAFATAIAAATNGINGIVFDTSSGTTTYNSQTVTARILVSVTGSGIWQSLNGGSTWALIASSPTDVGKMWCPGDGWTYALGFLGGSGITRIAPSTYALSTISGTSGLVSLAIFTGDSSRAWAVAPGWSFYAFTGALNGATAPSLTSQATGSNPVTALQCPWITVTNLHANELIADPLIATSTSSVTIGTGTKTFTVASGLNLVTGDAVRVFNTGTVTNYMLGTVSSYSGTTLSISVGSLTLGTGVYLGATATGGSGTFAAWTITKERCWLAQGSGLDYLDAPTFGGSSITVYDQSSGIESLSGNACYWPPSNHPILVASDFPNHVVAANPIGTTGLPLSSYSNPNGGGIVDGTQMCWVWNASGTKIICSVGYCGYSTDGVNWTAFASSPGVTYAYVAASTTSNIVYCDWNSNTVEYSLNGGASWATGGGTLPAAVAGNPYLNNLKALAVDDNGVFYLLGSDGYVYHSPTGATWTKGTNSSGSSGAGQIRTVPGYPGHLFVCDGFQYGPNSSIAAAIAGHPVSGHPLRFSADGGNTWTNISNTGEVQCVCPGKTKPGGNGYPSIFWIGWLSGVFGIYRIDSFNSASIGTTTHNFTGDYVANRSDIPCDIAACPDIWDWCIVAYPNGSGWAFRGYTGTWT